MFWRGRRPTLLAVIIAVITSLTILATCLLTVVGRCNPLHLLPLPRLSSSHCSLPEVEHGAVHLTPRGVHLSCHPNYSPYPADRWLQGFKAQVMTMNNFIQGVLFLVLRQARGCEPLSTLPP